ncbi:HEPN domain-containing protein [Oerskovia sp. NPDC056781]|uniref:ApeA N-terminal domain 1-containing protein n=1 Tax=Oerskovia sp. NPDC056781 TaxID=3345942 RepID=UPI003670034F
MSKLRTGAQFVTHTSDGESGEDEVVVVRLDEHGAELVWPRAIGLFDALALNSNESFPDPVVLRSGHGWLTLLEGRSLGSSASTLGHSEQRIRYYRAVGTGAKHTDYSTIHGMSSIVDGLARWARRTPVTQEITFDGGRVDGLTIRARNLEAICLGGPLGLELTTSYTHSPQPEGGVYAISTALEVRTRSLEAIDWGAHTSTHRMIQDLMCLVYGKPCLARLDAVMREDDQEIEPKDERRFWRDAYEPTFGRSARGTEGISDKDLPLFYLDDTDPDKLASWLTGQSLWSRPTWIGVTPLFHTDLPVESRLLQVAVALEALGAAIAKSRSEKPPTTFEGLLEVVFRAIGYAPTAIVGEASSKEWCTAFNKAYKGVKHADNPMTDPIEAYERSRQGLTLMRCWLAVELGVTREVLDANLGRRL